MKDQALSIGDIRVLREAFEALIDEQLESDERIAQLVVLAARTAGTRNPDALINQVRGMLEEA